MRIFGRKNKFDKEQKESEKLVALREKILSAYPEVEERWNKANQGNVEPLAARITILREMQDHQAYLEAVKALQQAINDRDREKYALQREIERLSGEIEAINQPVISEKVSQWQQSATYELKDRKIIQKVETRETIDAGPRIRVASNFEAIRKGKERLNEGIKMLRSMRLAPLSEILKFIEQIEKELGEIDFSLLTEHEKELTEDEYAELCVHAEERKYEGEYYSIAGRIIHPSIARKQKKEMTYGN